MYLVPCTHWHVWCVFPFGALGRKLQSGMVEILLLTTDQYLTDPAAVPSTTEAGEGLPPGNGAKTTQKTGL